MRRLLLLFPLLCLLLLLSFALPASAEDFTPVRNPIIAADFDGAWDVAAGDIDGDGDTDLVAVAHHDLKVSWFENSGGASSTWTEHVIATGFDGVTSVALEDFDRDGALDVVATAENAAKVSWWRNADGLGLTWGAEVVIDAAFAHPAAVAVGDIDRDGWPDVVAVRTNASVITNPFDLDGEVAWWRNDGTPGGAAWVKTTINGAFLGTTALQLVDINQDGWLDVAATAAGLNQAAWMLNNGTPSTANWTTTPIGTVTGAVSLALADINRDGLLDVAVGAAVLPDFTTGQITWFTGAAADGLTWTPQPQIDTGATVGLLLDDLDGDGDVDLAAAQPTAGQVRWYEYSAGTWTPTTIDAAFTDAVALAAADLDGDGDKDLIGVAGDPVDETTGQLVWWPNNMGGARSLVFSGNQQEITTSVVSPRQVAHADIDGDGDLDVIATSAGDDTVTWYANNGAGGGWTPTTITTIADGVRAVAVADVDQDGDLDVLTGSVIDDTVAWYANDGAGGGWIQNIITTGADGAQAVAVGDIDGDGDLDVISASRDDNKIAWHANDGTGLTWLENVISTDALDARSVALGDIDGDGDLDAVSASARDEKVVWYANDGSGGGWLPTVITTGADGAQSVALADLDNDGDVDVLVASWFDNRVAWYANDGSGGGWNQNVIVVTVNSQQIIAPGDIDSDGDVDVLSASWQQGQVAWYANDGTGGAWNQTIISTNVGGAQHVTLADLDGDGDLDTLSSGSDDGKVVWYANLHGPVLTTNNGLTTGEDDAAMPLTLAMLAGRDNDTPDAALSYNIVTAPTGTLQNGATPLGVGDSFTQGDIAAGNITYAPAGQFDALAQGDSTTDTLVFALDDGTSAWAGLAFAFTVTGVNDAPVQDTLETLQANAGLETTITSTVLAYADVDTPADALIYTLTTPPAQGELALNGAMLAQSDPFTQDDIDNGRLVYIHDGSATSADSFAFSLTDGFVTSTGTLSIAINALPQQVNSSLTVDEGAAVTLSGDDLRYTDADGTNVKLRYTVTDGPQYGTLSANSFTQADINAGNVTYTHDGSETLSDSVAYTLSDGFYTASGTLVITVTPVNDAPVLAINQPLVVTQGGSAVMTSAQLTTTDADTAADALAYTVTTPPQHGSLNVNRFTQADIDAGRVTYTHDDSAMTADSFTFRVTDGDTALNDTFTIAITPFTLTPTPTLTPTDGPSPTPTLTPTDGPSPTPTLTPTLTPTDGPSPTPTLTPTDGPSPTPTLTFTPAPPVDSPGDVGIEGDLTRAEVRPTIIWIPLVDGGGQVIIPDAYVVVMTADDGSVVVDARVDPADGCDETPRCRLYLDETLLPAGLLNGDYILSVRMLQGDSVTDVGLPLPFSVRVLPPLAAIALGVQPNQGRPSLVIADDPGVAWVQVWVGTADFQTISLGWYRKADAACDGLTCTLLLDAHPPTNGDYVIYFQTWGPGGWNNDDSALWQGPYPFTVNFPPPGPITPLSATLTEGTPILRWLGKPATTWYQVWAGTFDPPQTAYTGWLAAADLGCAEPGLCTAVLPPVDLAPGQALHWYVRAWGPGGINPGGVVDGWVGGDPVVP